MATKAKEFDCVEMKRQAQKQILAEWERRRHEFPSYGAYLEASIRESQWGRTDWERAGRMQSSNIAQ
jgi:hypothetical protein